MTSSTAETQYPACFDTLKQAVIAIERIGLEVRQWPLKYRDDLNQAIFTPAGTSVGEVVMLSDGWTVRWNS
jgi:hypothetical protein